MLRDGDDADAFLAAMLLNGHGDPLAVALLDHLRARHVADAAAAGELIAAFAGADGPPAPETLGHMLRGFFTGCRQAIDFEQLAILTLAGHRLTRNTRALLADALMQRVTA